MNLPDELEGLAATASNVPKLGLAIVAVGSGLYSRLSSFFVPGAAVPDTAVTDIGAEMSSARESGFASTLGTDAVVVRAGAAAAAAALMDAVLMGPAFNGADGDLITTGGGNGTAGLTGFGGSATVTGVGRGGGTGAAACGGGADGVGATVGAAIGSSLTRRSFCSNPEIWSAMVLSTAT
jgi:hypothetical protein